MWCGLAIAVLLIAIIKVGLEPFVALLLTGLLPAPAAGLPISQIVGTPLKAGESLLEAGFGGILGHIAVIMPGLSGVQRGCGTVAAQVRG
ncbi:GntT/GntP/DsdX family permease [Nocardia sp. IBHARD005]|uniref:GntT/GntP/DsdX family permease n=1 Tax=Nocardia sp. IBHARD005 TaxID=3457765 RepID=UPI00405817AE